MKKWDLVRKDVLQANGHHCHITTYYAKGDGAGVAYKISYFINKSKIFAKTYFTSSDDVISSKKYPDTIEKIILDFRDYCASKDLFDKFYNYFLEKGIEKINKIALEILLNQGKIPWFYTEKLLWDGNKDAAMSLFHDVFNPVSSVYSYLTDVDRFEILKAFCSNVVNQLFGHSELRYVTWHTVFYDGAQRIKKLLFTLETKGIIQVDLGEYISNLDTAEEVKNVVEKEILANNENLNIRTISEFWIDHHLKDDSKQIFEISLSEVE